ncbi:TonB-dependent receptor [Sphingomonas hylomeconis]|uniref:TonB-dependent receptor n=1 Tax=Sphingomonas hylomeconis TaxID=1395958 RepID=A0ABV7ST31_9SPHN|nr:TonB-dependent receptor [Sphingomonas hylomeconis]
MTVRTALPRAIRYASLLAATALTAPAFASTLSGTVVDASGTRSLQGAEVSIEALGRVVEAQADGSFRISDLKAGHYIVTARYVGATPVSQEVDIVDDADARLDFSLGATSSASGDIDDILVIGIGANQASALSRQKAADGVESVLSRDAIGQNPDQNVAESLRRVPGISVQDDQGEGRFVVIRGLAPQLNNVTINGVRIPSPEADNRALALDTIPSELVESIEVKKTLTPDMDGDTIGGSVSIKTTSAFDRKKDLLTFTLEGSRNDLRDKWSPKGSVDFSKLLSDNFGISGGFSYYKRRFGTDGVEAADWTTSAGGVTFPGELDYRAYDVTRTRIAGSLSLDWRPSDTTTLYAKGIVSSFRDDELRSRLRFTLVEGTGATAVTGTGDSATFASGASSANRVRVRRELKDRTETQDIYSVTAGGVTATGNWKIEYSGSYSYADEIEPNRQDTIFDRRFQNGASQLNLTLTGLDTQSPEYSVSNPALFTNGSDTLSKIETTDGKSVDQEYSGRLDVAREMALDNGSLELKAGGKVRIREKHYDLDFNSFDALTSGSFPTLAGLSRSIGDRGLIDMNPAVDPLLVRGYFNANRDRLVRNPLDSDLDSLAASYRVDEDIYAGYAQARYDNGTLRVLGGVRVEQTRNKMRGNAVTVIAEKGTLPDGTEATEDTLVNAPVSLKRQYTNWLPSVNVRFAPDSKLVFRLAATKSLVRPNISDLAPRFSISEDDEGGRDGEFGNPDLKPYDAWNFDGSAEYYFAGNAVLQVGLFHKRIKDFIFQQRLEDVTVRGINVDTALISVNGDTASVTGVELNLQAKLDFLPSPLDGLLVSGNYTYVDSKADIGANRLALPGTSKSIYNATIGYEKGPIQLRASASYRDKYIDEVAVDDDGNGTAGVIVDHRLLFDVGAKLRVDPRVQLTADFINIGNEPFDRYYGADGRVAQHEQYGWTGKFGVKVTL